MDKQFRPECIREAFAKIGAKAGKPLSVYLIGGCSMPLRGIKESTKDVDMVFRTKKDFDCFCEAAGWAQFLRVADVEGEYAGLVANRILRNRDGLTLDLFVARVLGKLALSKAMVGRAELHGEYGKLKIFLLGREDIFLFKALASESRKRDLSDMSALYPGLDWDTILGELESQELSSELNAHFVRRLSAFSQEYRLDVPKLGKPRGRKRR